MIYEKKYAKTHTEIHYSKVNTTQSKQKLNKDKELGTLENKRSSWPEKLFRIVC